MTGRFLRFISGTGELWAGWRGRDTLGTSDLPSVGFHTPVCITAMKQSPPEAPPGLPGPLLLVAQLSQR